MRCALADLEGGGRLRGLQPLWKFKSKKKNDKAKQKTEEMKR